MPECSGYGWQFLSCVPAVRHDSGVETDQVSSGNNGGRIINKGRGSLYVLLLSVSSALIVVTRIITELSTYYMRCQIRKRVAPPVLFLWRRVGSPYPR